MITQPLLVVKSCLWPLILGDLIYRWRPRPVTKRIDPWPVLESCSIPGNAARVTVPRATRGIHEAIDEDPGLKKSAPKRLHPELIVTFRPRVSM